MRYPPLLAALAAAVRASPIAAQAVPDSLLRRVDSVLADDDRTGRVRNIVFAQVP